MDYVFNGYYTLLKSERKELERIYFKLIEEITEEEFNKWLISKKEK